MACARCGCGVYQTEDIITLNKLWHKCCFTCYKCKQHLDKCTAKIFQGEVFCETCYNCMVQQLERCLFEQPEVNCCPSKPSRVVSSPSCSCEKVAKTSCCKQMPSFDYCKKYEVCFPAEPKVNCSKPVRSCSCIPDRGCAESRREPVCKKQPPPHCFAFPIPREVANYYNRVHMRPRRYTSPPNCCRSPRCEERPCIKIRTLSPCRSPSPPCQPRCSERPRCGCSKCCPPRPCPPRPICCHTRRRCSPIIRRKPSPCRPDPCRPDPCCSEPPCRPDPSCRSEPPCRLDPPCRSEPPCRLDPPCRSEPPCRLDPPCRSDPPCFRDPPCRSGSPRCSDAPCRREPPCRQVSRCRSPSPCRPRSPNCADPPRCVKFPNCMTSPPCCDTHCDMKATKEDCPICCFNKMNKYCVCGNVNPCNCKLSQIRALCTAICVRCGHKVYAAERILVTSGAYHTSCFSCYCCHKLLDVKSVYENCGEIYCKQCYNSFFGIQYYGYGTTNIC